MYEKQKKDIVDTGRALYDRGMLVGTDGNMSIRVSEDEMLITASGVCKGKLTEDLICLTDMKGNIKEGPKPARDIKMHLAVYESRPKSLAVVHAHPPAATGWAMTELAPDRMILPEITFNLGEIAVTDFALPTTDEVPAAVRSALTGKPSCGAIILANHGATTWGQDIEAAFYRMETLEMYVKALAVSKILGTQRYLTEEEEEKVNRLIHT